jgi:hypothetical protein
MGGTRRAYRVRARGVDDVGNVKPWAVLPNGPPKPTLTIAPPGPAVGSIVRKNVWYCPCGNLYDVKTDLDEHIARGCPAHNWRTWG